MKIKENMAEGFDFSTLQKVSFAAAMLSAGTGGGTSRPMADLKD